MVTTPSPVCVCVCVCVCEPLQLKYAIYAHKGAPITRTETGGHTMKDTFPDEKFIG